MSAAALNRLERIHSDVAAIDWSAQASPRFLAWSTVLALLGFTLGWWLLSFDWHVQHPDIGFYQSVGDATASGEMPYRDFDPTYPPLALPLLVLPSLLGAPPGIWEEYAARFMALMLDVGWIFVAAAAVTLQQLRASRAHVALGMTFVALTPLLVGNILPARFDLWPAALTTLALGAVVAGRDRVGSAVFGLAIAAKVYPFVLVPLVLLHVWRARGWRAAVVDVVIVGAAAAATALPFLLLSPEGLMRSLSVFLSRPLQVESSGAAVLWAADALGPLRVLVEASHGSHNLVGPLPDTVAAIQGVLLLAALGGLWLAFARRRNPTTEDLLAASAAAVCAFVLFGKVLSGQFVIWLIPLVAVLGGSRGVVAALVLAVALVLQQQWYPERYTEWVAGNDPAVSWIVLARDLALAGLLATLIVPANWLPQLLPRRNSLLAPGPEPAAATARLDPVKSGAVEPGLHRPCRSPQQGGPTHGSARPARQGEDQCPRRERSTGRPTGPAGRDGSLGAMGKGLLPNGRGVRLGRGDRRAPRPGSALP